MADYEEYSAKALKIVLQDGSEGIPLNFSITQVIVPPNEKGAEEYKRYSPEAQRYLLPDGSQVVGEFSNGTTTSAVQSVNGKIGIVTLTGEDIPFSTSTSQSLYNLLNEQLSGISSQLGEKADMQYTYNALDNLENEKASIVYVDTQTNLKVSKSGDIMTGTLFIDGPNVPIQIAAKFNGTDYAPILVATDKDINGNEKTAFEIFLDKTLPSGSIEFKGYNPLNNATVNFVIGPEYIRPKYKVNNVEKELALLEDVTFNATDYGKRFIAKNTTNAAVPNTETLISNVVPLVEFSNGITGATLNNNVITLPIGIYTFKATLNIIKTANSSIVELALIKDSAIFPESARNASWGNGTAGKASFPYSGNIVVENAPISFNVGILAGSSGVNYNTSDGTSSVFIDIMKIG